MSLIALKDLSLTLGSPLFADLSLTIAPGDRIGLVAANGRGKTSLLRVLTGALEPTGGSVTRGRGLTTGLVPQDVPPELLPLSFRAAAGAGLTAEEDGWRVDVALDDLEVPEALRDQTLQALSGGWQRMALLARAAISEPDLLLMDEPTNHLDIEGQEALEGELCAQGATCLFVSHDRAFVRAVATRFWVIDRGKLVEAADPEAFFAAQMAGLP